MCKCAICHRSIDSATASVSVNLANRRAASVKKASNARVCAHCASVIFEDDVDYPMTVGAQTADGLSYQLFIPCEYDTSIRAEFMQADWLPCRSGFKSPVLNNMKWHKRFITLSKMVNTNQHQTAHGKLTGLVSFAIMRDGKVLEEAQISLNSRKGFLEEVRELVAAYK